MKLDRFIKASNVMKVLNQMLLPMEGSSSREQSDTFSVGSRHNPQKNYLAPPLSLATND